ncbi:MAG TPA: transcription elongation factor GreB [Rhodocyclaceae bacterium]|nr:transcription elongation factor GreB [Rhodocyclaceae bacterium]
MSKAFTKESEVEADEPEAASQLPAGTKNYMTQAGYLRLKAELDQLLRVERPDLVKVVAWAASNGDRSENGDYIYGKRRLREIDRRIRFLIKRLESATVINPAEQENTGQVFFGATVRVTDADGIEADYQIVGVDEANASNGKISWISPLARALLKAREGDTVKVASPGGLREIDILEIRYQ